MSVHTCKWVYDKCIHAYASLNKVVFSLWQNMSGREWHRLQWWQQTVPAGWTRGCEWPWVISYCFSPWNAEVSMVVWCSGVSCNVWTAKDARHLEDLASQLYSALDEGHYLGKSCPWRPVILKAVFKLLDQESPRLLLRLARLILAVSYFDHSRLCVMLHGDVLLVFLFAIASRLCCQLSEIYIESNCVEIFSAICHSRRPSKSLHSRLLLLLSIFVVIDSIDTVLWIVVG